MIKEDNITGVSDTIRFVLEIDKLKGILRKVSLLTSTLRECRRT
jgi:hypothetical protein